MNKHSKNGIRWSRASLIKLINNAIIPVFAAPGFYIRSKKMTTTKPTEYLLYAYTVKKKRKTAVFLKDGEIYKLIRKVDA